MTPLERLARAVLAFHRGSPWTGTERNEWVMLTGEEEATTRVLCNLARRLLAEAVHDQGESATGVAQTCQPPLNPQFP